MGIRENIRSWFPLSDRSKALVVLSAVAVMHGWAYLPVTLSHQPQVPLPQGLLMISQSIDVPVQIYCTIWFIAGFGGIWASVVKPVFHHYEVKTLFQAVLVAMYSLWGLAYIVGWAFTPGTRQWLIGLVYLSIAAIVYFFRRMVAPVRWVRVPPGRVPKYDGK